MTFKNFVPFDNFTLQTNLSETDVWQRIENITEAKEHSSSSFSGNSTKPYVGELSDRTFKIWRVPNQRNSFLPIIKGQVATHLGKTEIAIKMRPAGFVVVFMCLWLGIVGIPCVGIIINTFLEFQQQPEKRFSPFSLIPFGMFAFGYALLTIAYKTESRKSKAFLKQLLEADEL
ncbi:MAG TPA: hypothetical protein VMR70_06215 [Flavisolibacter sp.]|nr:hypothetical protein [Flavisolibacter sp.]